MTYSMKGMYRFHFIIQCDEKLAALAQMVACLPLVQEVRGSIPGGVVKFNLKIFNLGARRGMYVEKAYNTVERDSSVGWGR